MKKPPLGRLAIITSATLLFCSFQSHWIVRKIQTHNDVIIEMSAVGMKMPEGHTIGVSAKINEWLICDRMELTKYGDCQTLNFGGTWDGWSISQTNATVIRMTNGCGAKIVFLRMSQLDSVKYAERFEAASH